MKDGTHYDGYWQAGKYSGSGKLTWPNGDVYTGNFWEGRRHGKGSMKFANGNRYDGQWKDDLFSGLGLLISKNGDRYEGDFVGGKKHGTGI